MISIYKITKINKFLLQILIFTSGFQSGAISRAEENGIALIQVVDKKFIFIRASISDVDKYTREFQIQYPPYLALQYTKASSVIPDIKIYPTTKMEEELKQKIKNIFNYN